MTTLTTRRLDVLTRVAESHTGRAAEAVARSRTGLAEQEMRLGELRRYAEEYRARPMPMAPALIANRERFLARLDEAERQQVRTVEAAAKAVRESTQQWLDRRAGQQKFDTLHDAAALRCPNSSSCFCMSCSARQDSRSAPRLLGGEGD